MENSLDYVDRDADVKGFGGQAHAVVAGLIFQFAGDDGLAGQGGGGDFEFRHQIEVAGVDGKGRRGEAVFFHLRRGVAYFGGFQRPRGPGELQRDQVIVEGLIAVAMISLAHDERQLYLRRGADLDGDLFGWLDGQDVIILSGARQDERAGRRD
jgi:hypothetical protein